MTDDELRKAAEWVLFKTRDGEVAGMYGDGVQGVSRRLLELLPPADDGEIVALEWLQAAGRRIGEGYRNGVAALYAEFVIHANSGIGLNFNVWCDGGGYWFDTDDDETGIMGGAVTRGHVRRLCAALGITLTESK